MTWAAAAVRPGTAAAAAATTVTAPVRVLAAVGIDVAVPSALRVTVSQAVGTAGMVPMAVRLGSTTRTCGTTAALALAPTSATAATASHSKSSKANFVVPLYHYTNNVNT